MGKLSPEEFQAAHERIFKAINADHDGTVTWGKCRLSSACTNRSASPVRKYGLFLRTENPARLKS
jgi:hypothetical protein